MRTLSAAQVCQHLLSEVDAALAQARPLIAHADDLNDMGRHEEAAHVHMRAQAVLLSVCEYVSTTVANLETELARR